MTPLLYGGSRLTIRSSGASSATRSGLTARVFLWLRTTTFLVRSSASGSGLVLGFRNLGTPWLLKFWALKIKLLKNSLQGMMIYHYTLFFIFPFCIL